MIICRTPFRVSFFGGGTDYPVWYREHGGCVLSTSIDKYSYITCRYLPPFFDFRYRLRYYDKEEVAELSDIRNPTVRECLRYMAIDEGVEITHSADLPARAGLGSSSTFTVGLLHATATLKGEMVTKRQLALRAIEVEQKRVGEHVGSQDQTSAAFGGFNRIDFGGPQEIVVSPIVMTPERLQSLQASLMLFFTGLSRNAGEIAQAQIRVANEKATELRHMVELVDEAMSCISGATPLEYFGRLLHEQWMVKRSMTNLISDQRIDGIYKAGTSAGALGGKLLGAGGGGFMLFFVPTEQQARVREALHELLEVPFYFEYLGSQIIYYSHV